MAPHAHRSHRSGSGGGPPPNTLWDGLLHAVTYLFTVPGIVLLVRAVRRPAIPTSSQTLVEATLVWWGVFDLVEGVFNHHALRIHHVWPAGPGSVLLWDVAFLAWGAVRVALGYALFRRDGSTRRAVD